VKKEKRRRNDYDFVAFVLGVLCAMETGSAEHTGLSVSCTYIHSSYGIRIDVVVVVVAVLFARDCLGC
jgi:hypothetical protein